MILVTFTSHGGGTVLVNADHVTHVVEGRMTSEGSFIHFISGQAVPVKETASQVWDLFRGRGRG